MHLVLLMFRFYGFMLLDCCHCYNKRWNDSEWWMCCIICTC